MRAEEEGETHHDEAHGRKQSSKAVVSGSRQLLTSAVMR
jgi:hypothetical protein